MKIPTILQLISSNGFYGAENIVLELSLELIKKKRFYPVVGVFKNQKNPHIEVAEECKKSGIETIILPCRGKFDLNAVLQLRRFIKKNHIEIVHSHGYKSNLYSYFSSLGLSTYLIATCHNWLGDDPKMKFYARLDKFFLRRFDKAVSVSDEVKSKLIDSGLIDSQLYIIRNGISSSRFALSNAKEVKKEDIKCDLGIPTNSVIIGCVGRLSAEKGQRYLLNISEPLMRKYPNVYFLMIGDGILKNELQSDFSSKSIIFTGIRKDLDRMYRCMDIFVLPSLTEGLPMALLEAMASGLPVVATRVGAVPDVIEDKVSGFIVSPGDQDGLLKALLCLLDNPEAARTMGQSGSRRVKEHFSSDTMSESYMTIYQNLIDKGTRQ